MKIAVIVPALVNQGPVLVAKDIISGILKNNTDDINFTVFYFDEKIEVNFPCKTQKIKLNDNIDFSCYDIIHSHMLRPDYFVWKNRKKLKNIPKISTLHQDIVQNLSASYNKLIALMAFSLWMRFLKSFNRIVVLSENMKKLYCNNIPLEKLTTIYNGRDNVKSVGKIDTEDLMSINQLKTKYTLIGVVALLTKRKGVHQLLKAMVELEGFALIIVGDGKEKPMLIAMAEELGINDRCIFLGYKSNGKDYMEYIDIFAMTSYSEGFPLSVLEFSQYNKPVICSSIPLFQELFSKNEVSFFELDNTESLQKAIINAKENYEELGNNLPKRVKKEYSYNSMIDNYYKLYQSLLKDNTKIL
ncbi:glycosyltransferase family 4 protein [Elizabethkingia anophelis]|nr:glycosyltransferase family 4 protein [Elizabethkingia anophelis]